MLPAWISDYIGREWHATNWNCWTLCRDVAANHLGEEWPSFDFISASDRPQVARTIMAESANWRELMNAALFREGERGEQLGDIAVLRYGMWGCHVGLIVAPNRMLHVDEAAATCVADLRSHSWRDRVIGIYRRWT